MAQRGSVVKLASARSLTYPNACLIQPTEPLYIRPFSEKTTEIFTSEENADASEVTCPLFPTFPSRANANQRV